MLQKDISDSVMTTLEYKNGISGHIFTSWLHPFKEHKIVIVGTNGMISYEDSSNKEIRFYDKKFSIINDQINKIDKGYHIVDYANSAPLTNQMKYFIDHLDGNEVKISNGQHALEVLKILIDASRQIEN